MTKQEEIQAMLLAETDKRVASLTDILDHYDEGVLSRHGAISLMRTEIGNTVQASFDMGFTASVTEAADAVADEEDDEFEIEFEDDGEDEEL